MRGGYQKMIEEDLGAIFNEIHSAKVIVKAIFLCSSWYLRDKVNIDSLEEKSKKKIIFYGKDAPEDLLKILDEL